MHENVKRSMRVPNLIFTQTTEEVHPCNDLINDSYRRKISAFALDGVQR